MSTTTNPGRASAGQNRAKFTPNSAEQFFYDNAGYSYDPQTETKTQGRKRCAQSMAKAERAASEAGFSFEWVEDEHCSVDDFDFEEDKEHLRNDGARGCICRNMAGEVLASLWGITESLDNRERNAYRRVIEAELASEAIA